MQHHLRSSVVLLDAAAHIGFQVVHSLAATGRYDVAVLPAAPGEAFKVSRHCRHIAHAGLDLQQGPAQIRDLAISPPAVLFPCSADATSWATLHRTELTSEWRLPPLPPVASLRPALDKLLLAPWAERAAVDVPCTVAVTAADTQPPTDLPFPLLLKPRHGAGGFGIVGVREAGAWSRALASLAQGLAYIAQPEIPGEDVSCGLFCRDGHVVAAVAYAPVSRADKYGAFRSLVVSQDPAVLAAAARLAAVSRWSGLVNLDFRRATDGRVFLLDVNPRPWGNMRGLLSSGVNFADLACQAALGRDVVAAPPRNARYFGTVDTLSAWRRALSTRHMPAGGLPRWSESALRFVVADPWPHWITFRQHVAAAGIGSVLAHLNAHTRA